MTQAKHAAHLEAIHELEALQNDLQATWLDKSLPDDWTGLDLYDPVEKHKTRVTIRLDSDMLRWFRKLGPGYQKRINRVLRIYWMTLLAGHIHAYPSDKTILRLKLEADRIHQEIIEGRGQAIR